MKTEYKLFISCLVVILLVGCSKTEELESDLKLPGVSTGLVTNITFKTAKADGTVNSDGGYTVESRGVCWSQNSNPTIDDYTLTSGKGKGKFNCQLENLKSGTQYYLRAFAVNKLGTQYGNEQSFTTQYVKAPTVTTDMVSAISNTSAKVGGTVTDEGGATVTQRGICYMEGDDTPTLSNISSNNGEGIGYFEHIISGLKPNTAYSYRAYATNSSGTGYGNTVKFTTSNEQLGFTLNDYLGNYSITYKEGSNNTYVTYNPVEILEYFFPDEGLDAFVSGLMRGQSSFEAYGIWDANSHCILLQGGYYNPSLTFYFNDAPNVLYYGVFFPVFRNESTNTFYYLSGGDIECGEAILKKHSNGTISFEGAAPDNNNRIANGFVYCYYSASTDEYKGYFSTCHHITLSPSASSSGVIQFNSMNKPVKLKNNVQRPNNSIQTESSNFREILSK